MLAFSHQAESRIYKENDEDTCTSDWRNIRTKHSVVKAEAALCVESDGIHPLDLKESSPKNEIWVIIYSPQYRWKDRWRWVVDKTFLQFHRKNTFLYTTQADGDYTFFWLTIHLTQQLINLVTVGSIKRKTCSRWLYRKQISLISL